jgi:hypothetical protein
MDASLDISSDLGMSRIGILLAGECLDVTVAVSIGIVDDPSFAWFAFSC